MGIPLNSLYKRTGIPLKKPLKRSKEDRNPLKKAFTKGDKNPFKKAFQKDRNPFKKASKKDRTP